MTGSRASRDPHAPVPRPPLTIRQATADDAELLYTIGLETFSDTFSRDNTPEDIAIYLAAAFSRDIQAAELAAPRSWFLIAETEGEPAGYARLVAGAAPQQVTGTNPIEIVRLYSRAAWIGRGVGAALMRACLETATDLGCDTVWLGVWERNQRAIAFYERWGFRKVGSHPFMLGHDAQTDWLMQRPAGR